MSISLKLKAKASSKRAEAQKILDVIANGVESRDMSPEEKTRFEDLMSDVAMIKTQITQAVAMEQDEAAEETAALKVEAERSIPVRRSTPPNEAAAVHTEKRVHSLLRAIRLASDQKPIDGLEGEVSREVERRTGQAPRSFYVSSGSDPEMRKLMYPNARREIRRDLTTTTGAGSIFLEHEEPFIELLRAKLLVRQLGATIMTGMKGTFALTRQSAKSSVYWLGEGNSTTGSNPVFDQVPFNPKVAIDQIAMSRQFILQSSLDAEAKAKNDLAKTMAQEWDRVCFAGSGAPQPLGILNNTLIPKVSLGTNGGPMTYAATVAMESSISQLNADDGTLAYVTNPSIRGELKTTPMIAPTSGQTGFPMFVWGKGQTKGVGEVNNLDAYVTTNIPNNLTKGTGTNLSAVILGLWSDLVVAEWDTGMDFLVNPYTLQSSGGVIISMMMAMDCNVEHPEGFCNIVDAS